MQPPRKWSNPPLPANATAGEAFVANLRAAVEQIQANAAGAAVGRNPEYLHQLRVGVRRLRSALRAFRALVRRHRADGIERPWRAMMRTLGAARDWDVFCQTLAPGALRTEADRRRAKARHRARVLVRSPGFARACRSTFSWAQRNPWRRHARPSEPLQAFARRALERLYEGLRESVRDMDWRDSVRRHAVRIRVKRMHYGCDFFHNAFPHRSARNFLESLRSLQDILGEMNDIEVQRGLLRRLVTRASPRAMVEAVWTVRERLATRERELIGALGAAWAAFEARRLFWRPEAAARAGE